MKDVFRHAEQTQGESIDSFVLRLKKLAVICEFGDNRDDFIRDKVIDKMLVKHAAQTAAARKRFKSPRAPGNHMSDGNSRLSG